MNIFVAFAIVVAGLGLMATDGASAQSGGVSFSLSPSSGTLSTQAQEIDVVLNTGGKSLTAAQVTLTFDNTAVYINSFEYGDAVPDSEKGLLEGTQKVSNENGFVTAPLAWLAGYSGTGTVLTLNVNALKTSGTTTIGFTDAGGETNSAYEEGVSPVTDILGSTTGGTYTLGSSGGSGASGGNLPDAGTSGVGFVILGFLLIISSAVLFYKKSQVHQ